MNHKHCNHTIEPQFIQVGEIFTNQECPLCGSYLKLCGYTLPKDINDVVLYVECLKNGCAYKGKRTLI